MYALDTNTGLPDRRHGTVPQGDHNTKEFSRVGDLPLEDWY